MASFKISVEGLDVLKKAFASDASISSIIPDASIAILQFHNTLERRVGDLFNVPGSLSDVMIGKSVAPESLGKTFLRYSLQYRFKAIPLGKYPSMESPSYSYSYAPLQKDIFSNVYWKKGQYSKRVLSSVRRGARGFKVAARPGNTELKGYIYGDRILARRQDATWTQKPARNREGIRAPVSQLFGPSLMTLANAVYDKDSKIQTAVETLEDELIKAMVRFYD